MVYDPRLGRQVWKRLRKYVLERDHFTCQVRGPKCSGAATCVDHVVARVDGGDCYDPENLRGACRSCNASEGGKMNGRRRTYPPLRMSDTPPLSVEHAAVSAAGKFRIF